MGISSLFGERPQTIRQPTGFETLPGFAQTSLFEATDLLLDSPDTAFQLAPFTEQQRQASEIFSGLGTAFAPEQFEQRLTQFQDPFLESVIDTTVRDIQEATAGTLSDIGVGATAAGGFGGTRQAALEADTIRNLQRSIGDVTGQLRSQSFNNAVQNALASIGQELAIGGGLFDIGAAQQAIDTSQARAPITRSESLQRLVAGVPGGGGQVSQLAGAPSFLSDIGRLAGGIGGLISAF